MDLRTVEIILQLRDDVAGIRKDVAEIKGDIAAMKDLQAKINIAYDKSQSIEDRARAAVGQAPPTAAAT